MGSFFSPRSQTNTSSSVTSPNGAAADAYGQLLSKAQNVAGTAYNPYQGELTAGLQGAQQAGINATYATQGAANPYLDAAKGYAQTSAAGITPAGIQANMNPYTQQVINATLAQSNQQDQAQQNQLAGSTVGSGGLGNSRLGVMQGVLGGQQANARNSMMANLNSQNYQQATNTAATNAQLAGQGAFTMGNLGNEAMMTGLAGSNALMGVGGVQQGTQQAADSAAYGQYQLAQQYPFATTNWLAGIEGNIGPKMGSTTSGTQTTPTASPFSQVLGAGTALLGAYMGMPASPGTASAGTLGTGNGLSGSPSSWMPYARGGRAGYANGGGVAPADVSPGIHRMTANLAHAVKHLRKAKYADGGVVPYDPRMATPSVNSSTAGAMMDGNMNNTFSFDPSFGDGGPYGAGSIGVVPPPALAMDDGRFQDVNPGDSVPMNSAGAASHQTMASHPGQPVGNVAQPTPDRPRTSDIGSVGGMSPFSHALMTAGFSLMGNKDPSIGTAIGQAGLAGVGDYDRQEGVIRQSKLSQAELDQKAAQLEATVNDTQTRLKEQSRHDMAQEGIEGERNKVMAQGNQRFQYQTVLGQDGQPQVMAMPTRGVADPSATSVTPGAIQGKQSSYTYSPSQIEDRAQKAEKAARDAVLNQLKITGEQVEPAALALRLDAAGHDAYQGAKMRYNNLSMGRPISSQPVMSPTGQPAPAMGPVSAPASVTAVPAASSNGGTIPEGQTATNPKTGERMILKGGQWQPM